MAIIEPVRQDTQHPRHIKKYSISLRLWHWVNTIVISGSLLTVLINSTITDERSVSALIKNELKNAGATVSDEQAGSVAHALGDSVWNIHIYFGYVLVGLLLFRLVLEFFQLADQKFIRKMKSAYRQFQSSKKERELAKHELTVKVIYAAFYILLITMAVTGLFLAFEDLLAPFKSIRHTVKEVHGFCMYLILAFIFVHLAGVFIAERKDNKGIVSDMINGGGNYQ
ncbi:Ni,Fe-hydrogenase I cytochrome b subunit [Mucilaginibacter sp. OK268]|jgi:Ni,Fe-hydrogenase I cytochrome b subunit|uniref:cytochrome b/b6 domain-containing protein n=1 Tax=Mucilaginibacter sp. OK268 TaxID=1881048 RepID=UPI000885FA21|nr:cytochrome b/b6 domain-containing protein [Mucilaginibacter sp. OK268]SDP94267.1 Ni,Fe-hydrogenase I cytochrome b subunit [Mucilaginibacter sp. OK268]